jgi:hypothetical protein
MDSDLLEEDGTEGYTQWKYLIGRKVVTLQKSKCITKNITYT